MRTVPAVRMTVAMDVETESPGQELLLTNAMNEDRQRSMPMQAPTTTEVWSQLKDRLLQFFLRRVAEPETAEDLLQETFMRIHKGIDTLNDTQRLNAWVFRIARNLLTDHYRRSARQDPQADEGEVPVEELADPADAQFSLASEIASWMPGTIAILPEKYRAAVRMFEIENRSQQEIADKLGLSLSGAKSRIQRGREQIRQGLEACCVFDRDSGGRPIDYEEREGGNADACGCSCGDEE